MAKAETLPSPSPARPSLLELSPELLVSVSLSVVIHGQAVTSK